MIAIDLRRFPDMRIENVAMIGMGAVGTLYGYYLSQKLGGSSAAATQVQAVTGYMVHLGARDLGVIRESGGAESDDHDENQKQCDEFLHNRSPLDFDGVIVSKSLGNCKKNFVFTRLPCTG